MGSLPLVCEITYHRSMHDRLGGGIIKHSFGKAYFTFRVVIYVFYLYLKHMFSLLFLQYL